jgi:hypothetical protein
VNQPAHINSEVSDLSGQLDHQAAVELGESCLCRRILVTVTLAYPKAP